MEIKKNFKANLETKRFLFREVGIIVSLVLLFAIFEYSVKPKAVNTSVLSQKASFEADFAPVTLPEQEKKQMPIIKPVPRINTIIVETKNISEADTTSLTGVFNPPEDFNFDSLFTTQPIVEPAPFINPQKKPQYPGGLTGLYRDISDNLVYPDEAIELGQSGKVVVKFVVNSLGEPTNIEVIGVSQGIALDNEAKRIVTKLKKFTPAEQMGVKVPAYFMVPIEFNLR